MAVSDTESSTFALESDDMKLEILPPGQDATRIIPSAMDQLILGPSAIASKKVSNGRSTS